MRTEDWGLPHPKKRGLRHRKRTPTTQVEQEQDVLYVLLLHGPEAEVLRAAVHNHRDCLSKTTGRRCVFMVPGDPRHSDDLFLRLLSKMGIKREEQLRWNRKLKRFGDAGTARRSLCFEVAELLGIEQSYLPCLVYATKRSGRKFARFSLPLKWWLKPELADGVALKLIKILSEETVIEMLKCASEEGCDPLDLIEQRFRTLEDGVSWAEAYGLDRIDERLLEFYQGVQGRRILGKDTARKLQLAPGTKSKALRKLCLKGLLHNIPRKGYRLTSLGIRFQA